MTIAMLMANTLTAAARKAGKAEIAATLCTRAAYVRNR